MRVERWEGVYQFLKLPGRHFHWHCDWAQSQMPVPMEQRVAATRLESERVPGRWTAGLPSLAVLSRARPSLVRREGLVAHQVRGDICRRGRARLGLGPIALPGSDSWGSDPLGRRRGYGHGLCLRTSRPYRPYHRDPA